MIDHHIGLKLEERERDITHETSRVSFVSPDFTIDLDMPLHQDGDDFTVCQSILQPVPDDQDKRKALPRFVRSRRRLGGLQETARQIHMSQRICM